MNLKKNYLSGINETKSSFGEKPKIGSKNYSLYMKRGMPNLLDKTVLKNPKSLSINDKLSSSKSGTQFKQYQTPKNQETSFSNNKIDIKISVNYLKNNNLKDLVEKQKKEESNSLSNILIHDNLGKDNILNLKTNINDDKNIRKKIYSSEKDKGNISSTDNSTNQKLNLNNNYFEGVKNNLNNYSQLSNNLNESRNNVHKRNQVQNNEFIQNNLNISLLTYENRSLYNNTTTNKNNSSQLGGHYAHFKTKNIDNPVLLGNNFTTQSNSSIKDKNSENSFLLTTQQDLQANSTSHILTRNLDNISSLTNNNSNCGTGTNSNTNLVNNFKESRKESSKKYLLNLEKKLEEMINQNISNSDSTSNNLQKFKIYKKILEEYISELYQQGEPTNLLSKIGNGYSETVKSLIGQNNSNLEKLKDKEVLSSKYTNLSKKMNELTKNLEEKENEIALLKQKLNDSKDNTKFKGGFFKLNLEKAINLNIIQKSGLNESSLPSKQNKSNSELNLTTNTVINNKSKLDISAIIEKSDHNKIISNLNMNMIDDPEAFYFYDKVHMRSNSANIKKIPIMNFNKVDETLQQQNQAKQQAKIEENKKNLKEIQKIDEMTNISPIKDLSNMYMNNKKKHNYYLETELKDPYISQSNINKLNNYSNKVMQSSNINYK